MRSESVTKGDERNEGGACIISPSTILGLFLPHSSLYLPDAFAPAFIE